MATKNITFIKTNMMRLHFKMPKTLRPFFEAELSKYRASYQQGFLQNAWLHLERAHILGQRYPMTHNYVHWKMLQFGFRIKSIKEIRGQLLRLIFGGIKSFIGTVPVGNPGGANVPPMKPFPIDVELQAMFTKAGIGV
jgi:hypothetical protein